MLYDDTFIANIPAPQSHESRSLVNLKANMPWHLNMLNDWYNELLPAGDTELASRLRNIEDSEQFTAGWWELAIFRYLRSIGHDVLYKHSVDSKTPDLYWPKVDLIADVVSVSDPNYGEKQNTFIHELIQAIEELDLPFGIFITSFHFAGVSYKKRAMLDWISSLTAVPSTDLYEMEHEYDDGVSRLKLLIEPRTSGPVIKAVGMFHLDAEQTKEVVKRRIRNKLKKYQRPLMVFACSGQGFWNLEEDTLDMALYGDWQVIFSRDPKVKETRPGRASNGVFNNRQKNGLPANDRIIAVAYADRQTRDEKLFLRFKVYHNPYAKPPLPREFFGTHAQFVILEDRGGEFVMGTINEESKIVEVN